MHIIRPITLADIDSFETFALTSSTGITNLPKPRHLQMKKILTSIESFHKQVEKPQLETYIFVMEETTTGELGGTSSIIAKTGMAHPHYFYRIETLHPRSDTLELPKEMKLLWAVKHIDGPSEIASIYVLPSFRKSGLGRLLSLSRFLFISNFPERFEENIAAEMRGVIDKLHCAPFWECVGRHFYDVEFDDIMHLQYCEADFIQDVLPKHPIYVDLLPFEAQEAIGNVHIDTKPALHMLENEGFTFTNEVDLFDGGPKITAKKSEIRSIKKSALATVHIIDELTHESSQLILSNTSISFRACYGKVQFIEKDLIVVPEDIAKALDVKKGDLIRYVSTH